MARPIQYPPMGASALVAPSVPLGHNAEVFAVI